MKRLRPLLGLVLLGAAALSAGACADQAEGERCDKRNNNSDCSAGLVCKHIDGADQFAGACCPATGVSSAASCGTFGGLDASAGLGGAAGATGKTDAGSGGSSSTTDASADH